MDWKVSREVIEIYPHYNSDNLELAALGNRQFVIKKGMYSNGDVVIVVPEKSILPEDLAEPFKSYLKNGCIVKAATIRKEVSEGVLLPDNPSLGEIGEDVSEKLGISKYEPTIPSNMVSNLSLSNYPYHPHDCERFSININKIPDDAVVTVTEKLHGSLISITYYQGVIEITSKGLGKKGFTVSEDYNNFYWKAFKNSGLEEALEVFEGCVQIIGEALPCQKGFSYGFSEPTIKVFKVLFNNRNFSYQDLPESLKAFWVPILYQGVLDVPLIRSLCKGKSYLDENTLLEGLVVNHENTYLKLISEEYSKNSDGEEFN